MYVAAFSILLYRKEPSITFCSKTYNIPRYLDLGLYCHIYVKTEQVRTPAQIHLNINTNIDQTEHKDQHRAN